VWWYITVISALVRLREEDLEFKPSLGYIVHKNKKKKRAWFIWHMVEGLTSKHKTLSSNPSFKNRLAE
jgi:hypothetical protein